MFNNGLYVTNMQGLFYNRLLADGIYGHLELQDPSGDYIYNTADVTVPEGALLTYNVTFNEDVPPGNYCTIFWRYQARQYVNYQETCVNLQ